MRLFNLDTTHWYTRSGEPMHSVEARDGSDRPTTLRDARKLGLLPSVTNILGVIAKPELNAWKMEQAVLAALTLPRLPAEEADSFAKRVVDDASSRQRAAADFGTAFHEGAAQLAMSPIELDQKSMLAPWLEHYRQWLTSSIERVVWVERVLVAESLGYAGTADLLAFHRTHGLCLIDIKTQGVKPGAEARRYFSWGYQLAAYRRAIQVPHVTCLNVVINSLAAQPVVEMPWEEEELNGAEHVFHAANLIWRYEKGYDPRSEDPRPKVIIALPEAA